MGPEGPAFKSRRPDSPNYQPCNELVPTPIQGLGAYHRLGRYGLKTFDELGHKDMTVRDLAKRHRKGYDLLKMRDTLKGV